MNCPHRINGPLNAAGTNRGRGKTAYDKYSAHAADVQGFITEVEGQIDGFS